MTLKDAKALRDFVIKKTGVNCTVPLGFGPDGYFPRSMLSTGPRDWKSLAEVRKWAADRIRNNRRSRREYEAMMTLRTMRRRSPIEMMVDRACGLD